MVSKLNQQQAGEVEDIITSPPEHEPYDRLKVELVRRLATSREQRVRQLLSHEEMGDRKPSQFLLHLRGLAQDVPGDFLRTIWISRLLPQMQAIHAGQTEGSLDSTFQLADKICEVTIQSATASISPPTPDNIAGLLERNEELTRQVASLRASQTRSRSRPRNRRRNTPDYPSAPRDICWYHLNFGDRARKFTPPCYRQHRKPRRQRDSHLKDSHRQENSSSGR